MIKILLPRWTLSVFISGLFFLGAGPASAQIRVIIANPVEEAIHTLAEEFERTTGNAVAVEAMGTSALNMLLESDEVADIVIGTTGNIDQAVANGPHDPHVLRQKSKKVELGSVGRHLPYVSAVNI